VQSSLNKKVQEQEVTKDKSEKKDVRKEEKTEKKGKKKRLSSSKLKTTKTSSKPPKGKDSVHKKKRSKRSHHEQKNTNMISSSTTTNTSSNPSPFGITIRIMLKGDTKALVLPSVREDLVDSLVQKVSDSIQAAEGNVSDFVLLHAGKVLDGSCSLDECNLGNGSTLCAVRRTLSI
jgi:hypothetical protein